MINNQNKSKQLCPLSKFDSHCTAEEFQNIKQATAVVFNAVTQRNT